MVSAAGEAALLAERVLVGSERDQLRHIDVPGGEPGAQGGPAAGHFADRLALAPDAVPDVRLANDPVN
jgi:hypothetical protein